MEAMKKFHYAGEIKAGDAGDDVFFLDALTVKTTKRGSEYWVLTLRDRTGSIGAKCWGPSGPLEPAAGPVKVRFVAEEYQGNLELNVKMIRRLEADETIDPAEFLPTGPRDRFELMRQLKTRLGLIDYGPLRELARHAAESLGPLLRDAPAAVSMHHAYLGGLVEHAFSMMGLADKICDHYEMPPLSRDLLIAACLFHDLGKTRELTWDPKIEYTIEGELIGHVSIGLAMIDDCSSRYWAAEGVDERAEKTMLHLRHIVASHHGKLEFGAAKIPATREAAMFHMIDMIDSREGALAALKDKPDERGVVKWCKVLGGPLWVG